MLLAPSEIHFLHDTASHDLRLAPEVLDDVSHRLQENREKVPRIQVVEKDGTWFALNNSYLHVYRELERQGKCPKIRVDVVALSKVPQDVQKGMMVEQAARGDVQQPCCLQTDESLLCNVCERSFVSPRLLSQHQQRKRHYGCSICDSIFPNLMALEHHKESLDHWSEEEVAPGDLNGDVQDESDEESDDDDDDDEEPGPRPEELERLL